MHYLRRGRPTGPSCFCEEGRDQWARFVTVLTIESSIPAAVYLYIPADMIENSAHERVRRSHTQPDSVETFSSVPVLARTRTAFNRFSSVPWSAPGSVPRSARAPRLSFDLLQEPGHPRGSDPVVIREPRTVTRLDVHTASRGPCLERVGSTGDRPGRPACLDPESLAENLRKEVGRLTIHEAHHRVQRNRSN